MGINGLLKILEPITFDCSLESLRGQRVAVDGYVWLHRGVFHGATSIAKGKGNGSCVSYFNNRLKQLLKYDMKVTIVFDGAVLPAKSGKEEERARSRKEAFEQACEMEKRSSGSVYSFSELNATFAKSIDVTPEMAFDVSEFIKQHFPSVSIIVAPYEADAQLAYLCHRDLVDVVISEDSDLLVYGCTRVLYKLDFKSESGRLVECKDILERCPGLDRLSRTTFTIACILVGCDYMPGEYTTISWKKALSIGVKLEGYIQATGGVDVGLSCSSPILTDSVLRRLELLYSLENRETEWSSSSFADSVKRSYLTFFLQTVFCPIAKGLVRLMHCEEGGLRGDMSFLGEIYEEALAAQVADCSVHPETKERFVNKVVEIDETLEPVQPVSLVVSKKRKIVASVEQRPAVTSHMTLFRCWQKQPQPGRLCVIPNPSSDASAHYCTEMSEKCLTSFVDPGGREIIDLDENEPESNTSTVNGGVGDARSMMPNSIRQKSDNLVHFSYGVFSDS